METMTLKGKIDQSRKLIIDLPQYNPGDEVEIILVINSLKKIIGNQKKIFDAEQWANEWETDLGDKVKSTDVDSFTGREF